MNTVRKTRRILAAQVQNLTNQLAANGNEGRIKLKATLKAQAAEIERLNKVVATMTEACEKATAQIKALNEETVELRKQIPATTEG